MFYYDWTMLLILPGLLLGIWAQTRVRSAYNKYSRVSSRAGRPAWQVVRALLEQNNNGAVKVERVPGELTDHYDPSKEVLRLSDGVYDSDSLAALGIAAHEAGHAMQKLEDYGPMKFRNAVVPAVKLGSNLYFPIFLLGIVFSWKPLQFIGIICFGLTLVFSLITLPVEFDASKRGANMLLAGGFITNEEEAGVKAVLSAAAMTYVAAAISSLLQLIRLLIISRRSNDR